VPPDALEPCIKALANGFVSDRSSPEVMAVGINAIRCVLPRVRACVRAC
jgi:protein SDA1